MTAHEQERDLMRALAAEHALEVASGEYADLVDRVSRGDASMGEILRNARVELLECMYSLPPDATELGES